MSGWVGASSHLPTCPGYQLFSGSADAVDKSSSLLLRHLRSMFYHLSRLLTSLLTPLTSSQDPHLHQDPLVTELSGFYVTSTTCYTVCSPNPVSIPLLHSPIPVQPFPHSHSYRLCSRSLRLSFGVCEMVSSLLPLVTIRA